MDKQDMDKLLFHVVSLYENIYQNSGDTLTLMKRKLREVEREVFKAEEEWEKDRRKYRAAYNNISLVKGGKMTISDFLSKLD